MERSSIPPREDQTTGNIERAAARHVINLQVGMMVAVVLWLFLAVGASLLSGFHSGVNHVAILSRVQGPVDLLAVGGGAWRPVEANAQIEAGDRIRTGSDSAAQLTFFDGSTTDLAPETEVSVVQMSSQKNGGGRVIILQQRLGQTYCRVQSLLDADSRFEIRTPSAVASVRGTEFALDVAADGATLVVVVEGVVNVEAQDVTVPVEAGHGTVARPQQPPEPARPASTLPAQIEALEMPTSTEASEPTETSEPTEAKPASTAGPSKPKPTKEPQPTEVPQPTEKPRPTKEPKPTEVPQPTKEPKPTKAPKPTKEPQPTKEPKPTKVPKK